ncbi:glycerophosphodiester phosphodiesterase [Streptococcus suis]|nr:glycerophosphodiester phosphodiesterase [Streptococcus suis]
MGWDYAHRVFYDNSGDAPENSLTAYALAVQKGYGIEFDIRMTKDKELALIHDPSLLSTSGIDQNIEDCHYQELQKYKLFNSQEGIPPLADILDLVAGKVPLIVEIKSESRDVLEVCQRVTSYLDIYTGAFMVESFNPLIVAYFKKHRPNSIRGQLSGDLSRQKGLIYFDIKHLLTNYLTRPDFIAYEHEFQKNPSLNLIRLLFRIPLVVYTVKTPQGYINHKKRFDIQIFEGFDAKEM